MISLNIFLLFLVTIGRVNCEGCPDKWREFEGHCYLIGNLLGDETKARTWHNAKSACELMGAHLVVIETEAENDFIKYGLAPKSSPWIGLFDKTEKSAWIWVDGVMLENTFVNWAPGQPDHHETAPGVAESCVEIWQDEDGKWNDAGCHIVKEFICELDRVGGLSQCDIQHGWIEKNINGQTNCYRYDQLPELPWLEAEEECKAAGGDLVVISSETENDAIYAMMGADQNRWWIGLSNYGHVDHQMTWVTSASNFKKPSSYKNFMTGGSPPPSGKPSELTCTEQFADSHEEHISGDMKVGLWKTNMKCGEQRNYICEAKPMGSCPKGWILYNRNCYMINTSRMTTWVVARDSCQSVGASLLKITSDEEQHFLKSTLWSYGMDTAQDKSIWIGFSDSDQNPDGTFRWTDGSLVDDGHSYTNWADLQPLNNPGWDCGSFYMGNTDLKWETFSCFRDQGFICKIPSGQELKNPTHTQYKGCKPGWVAFKDPGTSQIHCYLFDHSGEVTWQEAEDMCKSYGPDLHLTSIHTGEEQSFIQASVHDSLWLGGKGTGSYTWSDGTTFDFDAWAAPDFPTDQPGERCISLLVTDETSGWVDKDCTGLAGVICRDEQETCWAPMGCEDGSIGDKQFHGSTYVDTNHHGRAGRLNGQYSWTPDPLRDTEDNRPYLKIDLIGSNSDRNAGFQIHGISTQGDSTFETWVTKFKIDFTSKSRPKDEDWQFIQDFEGNDQIFDGNIDPDSIHTSVFVTAVTAREIRIWPIENGYNKEDYKLYKSMRVEIYGCNKDGSEIDDGTTDETCDILLNDRLQCGFEGITAGECRSRGCCYDTSLATPHCFYHKGDHDRHCDPGWVYQALGISPHCYKFSTSIQRHWEGNIAFCEAERAEPLHIDNPDEMNWITDQTKNLVGLNRLWTGGNQENPNSGWTWYKRPNFRYMNWASGQPIKDNDYINFDTSDGKWYASDQTNNYGVGCKKVAGGQGEQPAGDAFHEIICEDQIQLLTCGPIQSFVINVKSAVYGRTSKTVCTEKGEQNNCKKMIDVTEYAKAECNNRHSCNLQPTNEFGDPCPNVYKYMDVYFECVESSCFKPLLENSGQKGNELTASTGTGKDAYYPNGGWTADANDKDIWLQYTSSSDDMYKLWGLSTWGTGAGDDTGKWVTEYYIEFQSKYDETRWYPYTESNSHETYKFIANSDPFSEKHHNLKDAFSFKVLRIRPTHWHTSDGDDLGSVSMRVEFYGCVSDDILSCGDTADPLISESSPDGTSVTKHCISNCREANIAPKAYGDGVYSGDSQICMAAIHAGVIQDAYGGDVTIVKQKGKDEYMSSYKNGVQTYHKSDGYQVSFAFSNPMFNCPKGSKEFGDYCYAFYANAMSWSEAENECIKSWDGHLASIHHNNEQAFIEAQIESFTQDGHQVWTGLKDRNSDGLFQWSDDSVVQFTNWNSGEPNGFGSTQICVQMYRNGYWDDHHCEKENGFVCKFNRGHHPVTDEGPDEGCEDGWLGFEDQCYLFVNNAYHSQEKAQEDCEFQHATLAKIPDHETNSFIYSTLSQMGFWEFWHGLENPSGDNQILWLWQDQSVPTFTNWAAGLPVAGNAQCAFFLGSTVSNGKWYQDKCQGKYKYYICQKQRTGFDPKPPPTKPPHPDGCPGSTDDGWQVNPDDPSSDYCYKIYTSDVTPEVNWKSALNQCRGQNGDLVSIESKPESEAMLNLVAQNFPDLDSIEFWIGFENTKDGWIWTDGTPTNYIHWAPFNPSHLDGHNAAVMYYQSNKNGTSNMWQNVLPSGNRPFICKIFKGASLPIQPNPPDTKPDETCSSNGVPEFDSEFGSWYRNIDSECFFVSKEKLQYFDAKNKCEKLSGSSLISIHSQSSQDSIQGAIKNLDSSTDDYLIGLKEDREGRFYWSDGSPVDYTQWDQGQPNDENGSQQCVKMNKYYGYWSDVNCGHKFGYICGKMKAIPPVPENKSHCSKGWLEYDDGCYLFGPKDDRKNWTSASSECKSKGGDLASIPTSYANAFLFSQSLSYVKSRMWIGLHDQGNYITK